MSPHSARLLPLDPVLAELKFLIRLFSSSVTEKINGPGQVIAWILSGSPSSPLIFRIIKFVPFSLPVNVVFFKYGMEIIPVSSIITTSFLLFHCKLLKCSLYLHHKPPYRNHYTPFLSTKHQEYLMLAVFLSPVYLLFQAYILLWLYAWRIPAPRRFIHCFSGSLSQSSICFLPSAR